MKDRYEIEQFIEQIQAIETCPLFGRLYGVYEASRLGLKLTGCYA